MIRSLGEETCQQNGCASVYRGTEALGHTEVKENPIWVGQRKDTSWFYNQRPLLEEKQFGLWTCAIQWHTAVCDNVLKCTGEYTGEIIVPCSLPFFFD